MKKLNKINVIVFGLILFFSAGLAEAKKLRSAAEGDLAYVMVDGSQSRKSVAVFGKKMTSFLHINEVADECRIRYHGKIKKSGKKSSDPVAITAGLLYEFYYVRQSKSSAGQTTMIDNRTDTSYFIPEKGHTYKFQINDSVKGAEIQYVIIDSFEGEENVLKSFEKDPFEGCKKVKKARKKRK